MNRQDVIAAILASGWSIENWEQYERSIAMRTGDNGKIAIRLPRHDIPLVLDMTRWRHQKRGTKYTMLQGARAQSNVVEGQQVIIYLGDFGDLHIREYSQFHDGRFERIED